MAVSNAFEELTAVLKFLERNDVDLQHVSVDEHEDHEEGTIAATLQIAVPLLSAVSFGDDVTIRADGTDLTEEKLSLDVTVSVPTDSDDELVLPRDAASGSPGGSELLGQADRDVPRYKDPEALRTVYERYDTFTEMTEALGVDVTSETVRRYMVEFDIHDPHDDPAVEARELQSADEAGDPQSTAEARDSQSTPESRDSQSTAEARDSQSTAEASESAPATAAGESDSVDGDVRASESPPTELTSASSDAGPTETASSASGARDESASTEGGAATVAEAATDTEVDVGAYDDADRDADGNAGADVDLAEVPLGDVLMAGSDDEHAADGLGLPGRVTLGEFVDVLESARTPHEVATSLEIDEEDCRRLLDELHLQYFVNNRISSTMAQVTPRVLCRRMGVDPEDV